MPYPYPYPHTPTVPVPVPLPVPLPLTLTLPLPPHQALLGGLLFTCTARDEEDDANAFATTFPQASALTLTLTLTTFATTFPQATVRSLARRSTLFLRVTRRHVPTPTHALSTHLHLQAPLVGLPCGGEIGPAARRGPALTSSGPATQKGSARLQVLYTP